MANTERGAVSENDIIKAEGIQPNEMSDLHNFLKNSNQVNGHGGGNDKPDSEAEMSDGKFVPSDGDTHGGISGMLTPPDFRN